MTNLISSTSTSKNNSSALQRQLSHTQAELDAQKEYSNNLEELLVQGTSDMQGITKDAARHEELSFLGKLACGVGHELCNPITAMKTSLYYLKLALPIPQESIGEAIHIMEYEINKIEKSIHDLMYFSRGTRPILRRIKLIELINTSLSQISVPESIHIQSDFQPADSSIIGDPEQLKILFVTMFTESVESMENEGTLMVNVERSSHQRIAVTITDTGGHDLFHSKRPHQKMCYSEDSSDLDIERMLSNIILENHDGTIDIQENIPTGRRVHITLPCENN